MPGSLPENEINKMYVEYAKHGSVRRVAKVCNRSEGTIRKYRDKRNWEEKRKQSNQKAQEKLDYDIVEEKASMLGLYRKLRQRIENKIKKGEYNPKNLAGDLDTVVRGELLVAGEPDSRPDIGLSNALKQLDDEGLRNLIKLGKLRTRKT